MEIVSTHENAVPFPTAWAERLPPQTVEAASSIVKSIYTLQDVIPKQQTASPVQGQTIPGGNRVLPPRERVFHALELTPPEAVRAVILGQDPYPTAGHANGLCFSVAPAVRPLPPSLRNIFKEYAADLGFPLPSTGDLTPWTEQGVLLLNTVLTVEEGRSGSHRRRGWQSVTDAVLRACLNLSGPVVFLLWGRDAQGAFDRAALGYGFAVKRNCFTYDVYPGSNVDFVASRQASVNALQQDFTVWIAGDGKYALRSSHPSPLGAGKPCGDTPPFLGSRPFSRANAVLTACGSDPIDWRLP